MLITDITIVITTFNSNLVLNNCLKSIDKNCKVIVVENSNNEKFKNNIESNYTNVSCFLAGKNLGYGKANNIGLKKVKTKYALILNPDTKLYQSTLKNFIEVTKKIPDFAIIGPYSEEEQNQSSKNRIINLKPISVKSVKGFAMFLKMSEFNEVGFFDESFFIYFEEIDLCRRLIRNNKKIYLAPEVKIFHAGGQSHDKRVDRELEMSRNWHWMWSTFNYHKKYKGYLISFVIILPKLISSFFKFIIFSMILNKEKKNIYYQRFSGLLNAIIGRSSWYRPRL